MSKNLMKDFKDLFDKDTTGQGDDTEPDAPRKPTRDQAEEDTSDRSLQTRRVNGDILEQALIDARAAVKKDTPKANDESDASPETAPKTNISDQIKEADFYLEQQLLTDAQIVLDDVVQKAPDNTTANAKLAIIDAMRSSVPAAPLNAPGRPFNHSSGDDAAEQPDYKPENHPSIDAEDVHCIAGVTHIQAGRFDQAIEEFDKALKWKQNELICHLLIGACYSRKGTAVKAIKHFKLGLHIDGISQTEATPFYYELGKTYEFLRDSQEAIYYYSKVAKAYPEYTDIQKKIDMLKDEEELSLI